MLLLSRWGRWHPTSTIPNGWLVVNAQLQTHLLPLLLRYPWPLTTPTGWWVVGLWRQGLMLLLLLSEGRRHHCPGSATTGDLNTPGIRVNNATPVSWVAGVHGPLAIVAWRLPASLLDVTLCKVSECISLSPLSRHLHLSIPALCISCTYCGP